MDKLKVFGDIGKVLGYPAMLLIFWLYIQVETLNKEMVEVKKESANMVVNLSNIRADVSYIRGVIEKRGSP